MRILMLVENNPYPQDPRVRNEALTLVRDGHQVAVIAPRAHGQERVEVVDGVRVYRFACPPAVGGVTGYLVEYALAMAAMAVLSTVVWFRDGFDVVHAHNPPDTLVLIAGAYRLFGVRFVFDLHDLSPEMFRARFDASGGTIMQWGLEFFERLSFRLADHVIVTNDSYAAIARERGGQEADRITVVRNGPDLQRVRPVAPDSGLRSGADVLIGYVGVMGAQDGVDYLLRALHRFRYDLGHESFRCILVGRGDAVPYLKELTERLELGEHVWFTGYVPDDELMRILSSVDLFVAPEPSNPFNDRSTMIKLMEYLAFSKPIVAFDLPEHRVTAGDATFYARPNDELDFAKQMEAAVTDRQRRERALRAGAERLASLSWAAQESQLRGAYALIAASQRSARAGVAADGSEAP